VSLRPTPPPDPAFCLLFLAGLLGPLLGGGSPVDDDRSAVTIMPACQQACGLLVNMVLAPVGNLAARLGECLLCPLARFYCLCAAPRKLTPPGAMANASPNQGRP
jgi:hypothetical protein